MSEIEPTNGGQAAPPPSSARRYIVAAAVLLVIIVVAVILLVTVGIPAWQGETEPTAAAAVTATAVPTFTPGPTKAPTNTPLPVASPTLDAPVMLDTDEPLYDFESAGARPSVEWTGFFGQVLDEAGQGVPGVSVIVWYPEGNPASPVVQTDEDGYYEIRLADAPYAGRWSIQLLADGYQPISKLFSFDTDQDSENGIQQIQVIWQAVQ